MFIVVDLPEPEAPMIATNSPSRNRQRHAAQRVDLHIAHGVGLVNVLEFNHRRASGICIASTTAGCCSCNFLNCLHVSVA
jgi:hypothetical protein